MVKRSSEAAFVATRWSLVLAAQAADAPDAGSALESLCRNYWQPLYSFVRRQGHAPHDAQDLTQAFFARLLERNYLASVDQKKGKFRSFLLASMKHFLANEWDKGQAQKRGGGNVVLSLDRTAAETAYVLEPADQATAEKVFERRWALTLLDRTLTRLAAEYAEDGKGELFEQLKGTLTGDRATLPYSTIAEKLGSSEGAIKVAVHRLRQRYREVLRAEIADTVSEPEEVEEELRNLFAALSG